MTKPRILALLVVFTHWTIAIWHLFLAADVLPAPNNHVTWLAVILLTLLHWGVLIALWTASERLIGFVTLIFFLAALSADLYEHFLQPSLNNVFMVLPGPWTTWFNVSVFILLALEILGCSIGIHSLGLRTKKQQST